MLSLLFFLMLSLMVGLVVSEKMSLGQLLLGQISQGQFLHGQMSNGQVLPAQVLIVQFLKDLSYLLKVPF